MKKIVLLFATLCLFVVSGLTQTTQNGKISLKVGSKLVYDVNNNNTKYQFIITIKKLENGITFDWQMTTPINKKGTVEMSKEATENATALFNYFAGGLTKLTDKTSVWISQDVWKDMHDDDEMVMLSLDDQEETAFFREDGEVYKTTQNTTAIELKTSTLRSLTDLQTITIWENEEFPIILKMDLGWTIELKEITS